MFKKAMPIGVMDSGVGGLTVVKELQKILPNENIIFYGDSANCPYGNRDEQTIEAFTCGILNFLKSNNCKIVAIACNTMSTLVDKVKDKYDFEVIGIVEPAAAYIAKIHPKDVGVVATNFTIKTEEYNELIDKYDANIKVIGQGSPILAKLIERGDFNYAEIDVEIKKEVDLILTNDSKVKDIVLGCTHYPIVLDRFKSLYPHIDFINPAKYQAQLIKNELENQDLLNISGNQSEFDIYTSGDVSIFKIMIDKLELSPAKQLTHKKIQ